MTVETDAGLVEGTRLSENRYRVRLNVPGVLDLHRTADAAYVELGCPGVPHAVVELPELIWDMLEPLRSRGVELRHSPAFPKGANVNFFTRLDESHVRVLTYERGVEDYTLACGTGCGSIAVTLWLRGLLPGGTLEAENRGGNLTVTVEGTSTEVTKLLLEGPAEVLKIYEI